MINLKTLYVKTSEDRKEEFQIITKIVEEDGKLYCLKEPFSERGIEHIKSLYKNYELMKRVYSFDELNKIEYRNGAIYSEYIKGKTLEEMAIDAFLRGDEESFLEVIRRFQKIVLKDGNITSFVISQGFSSFFGITSIPSCQGFKISNIDLNLDNIIVGEKDIIIDFEWVLDFSVPVDFVIYRALNSFYRKNETILKSKYSNANDFYNIFNLQLDVAILEQMNKAFAFYVHDVNASKKTQYLQEQRDVRSVIKTNEIARLNSHIEDISKWALSLDEKVKEKDETIVDKEKRIEELSKWGKSLDKEINEKNERIELNEKRIEELSIWGKGLNEDVKKLTETVDSLLKEIDAKNSTLEEKQDQIKALENKNKEDLNLLEDTKKTLYEKEERVEELSKWGQSLDQEVNYLRNLLTDERQKVENIKNEKNNLQNEINQIKSSHGYKFLRFFYRIRDFFIPNNSKRKLFLKVMVKAVRHPLMFIRGLKNGQARKFFRYLKSEGPTRTLERLNGYEGRIQNVNQLDSLKIIPEVKDYKEIDVGNEANPLVSIIIPVYNQFSYTYRAIRSIIEFTEDIKHEVIIADDNSTDETKDIQKYIKNITVSRNKKNLGFLLNCKNASKKARGKYILFLNNDTCVQPMWLDHLVHTIESDKSIGMVGSKLVYPDGRLQEAGGIIWNDASGWNYGRLSNPEASEYNYVKDVDYISGASIMISKKLWDKIGGFDERYVPAYFEDSDLAFEVRKAGYRVVYQPLSVVVHFEGISHGTNVNQGIKAYQVKNKEKFVAKWKSELENQYPNAVNVFKARERSKDKKTILVIDHYVPHIDKDAGSKTVYQYLKLFVSLGLNVKFIGDNFYRHEPYTTILQQMGIEVLYGPQYAREYQNWIKDNKDEFDYIFMNRPHISIKYIDFVKKHTKAKLIYYGHDLHFLRTQREYELTGNKALMKDIDYWRKIEFEIMSKADLVYYPSTIEVEYLKQLNSSLNVKVLTPYLFEEVEANKYLIDKRNGILFVGGFGHGPNIDAVLWFAKDIFPKIIEKNPKIVWYIIGSNPPEDVLNLASQNIIVKGFVSDEELTNTYKMVRLVVAPLRYGAGVKGKVVEAMKNGTPVVTTSVGAEGMENANTYLAIADTPQLFSEQVLNLYDNQKKLALYALKEREEINRAYTFKKATMRIAKEFEMLKK